VIHDFGVVWQERGLLLSGLANTVLLSVLASLCALLLGALLSTLLMHRVRGVARVARAFVDAMRCTPFLLFAYIVYYGLPSMGLRFDNWGAGLSALAIYHTAYMAEILRGAWASQPRAPIEAGVCGCFAASCCRR
jgi:polar amino acid transport system permease protein